jgi:hypothetical protein
VTFEPFHVDLDGVLELSRLHSDAATALNGAMGSAKANATGVDAAHGSIGTRVTGAFGEVLDARQGALKAASNTCNQLSDRLGMAVRAYAHGDERGAASVRAAAEAMDGGAARGSSGTPTASGSSGTSIATDSPSVPAPSGTVGAAESNDVADALGQAGQQGSQRAQTLGQDPDQVLQAVEQIDVPNPEQSGGVGAHVADSDDLATEAPPDAPPQPPGGSTADEQAERSTRD